VAELMRLCVDEHDMDWEPAWEITRHTFAYTNHTLLPEALETWPVDLFGSLLPRHLEIIYEINRRFLDELRIRFPFEPERIERMSLIAEGPVRRIRMANLATVGSFAVNGVAAMHSELVKSTVLRDFHELCPEKFHNVTNGVTPRRFIQLSNPDLCGLVTEVAGPGWARDADNLRRLEPHAQDAGFQERWRGMKRMAKERLAAHIERTTGVIVDPLSMFDIHVKRIHEYKRQHLNLLHILTLYERIKQNPGLDMTPRTFVFGGKAAPGYFMAKLIIKAIHSVAEVINRDPQVNGLMRVVFVPNFNVKNAEMIYPAADLSEQISTAGKEASGTGNMKFSMNGALTIGTLDGANVEIRDAVGHENFFLFGLTVEEVQRTLAEGYRPWDIYRKAHGTAHGDRPAPLGAVLAWRPGPVPTAHGEPDPARPLPAAGRLPGLRGDPEPGRRRLPGRTGLDPYVDTEHGAHGLLLVGPRHSRVLREDLACATGTRFTDHRIGC
jgi:glycogen phosphorylase